KQLNFRVLAAGDSYNDTTMLAAADVGILFRAPEQVKREFPAFQYTDDYATLRQYFDQASVND
ncbi:MAG: bifunctional phosphoserine phosphatase/homoserine phosphotransferase ThrH, partial [Pseudomonadota bacterium]|nr:bifunctional phosphoserine phosphatase/homoserine phosphotransferase ThrH [Pseudomonadota bacterium]